MSMEIEETLWDAYKNVYFFVSQGLGSRQFYQNVREFCIITAWNPHSVLLSQAENREKNHALEYELLKQKYEKILVGDRDRSWTEESYAVELSRIDSTKLAKKYRQNAIYYVQNDQIYLIPCVDCGRSEIQIGCFSQRAIGMTCGEVEGK